jgi:hypothetical protein
MTHRQTTLEQRAACAGGASAPSGVAVDRIRQQWPGLAGSLRRRWRKLTPEDVATPEGSAEALARRLELRYGIDAREAILQVYEFEFEALL